MPQTDSMSYNNFADQVNKLTTSNQSQSFEQQLANYPIDFTIDLIYDQLQPLDTRRMACSILKLKISNKQQCISQGVNHNQILARLQTLYMINSTNNKQLYRLQSAIQLVIQKIFQIYYGDSQKIKMFEQISQGLSKQPICKQIKHIQFLNMLLRQMNYLSVNSQILIGQMVLYLQQILSYINLNIINKQNSSSLNINNKNNLLQHQQQYKQQQQNICEILIKTIQLMKQIKQIVDQNNQDQQNVVGQFMINSKLLKKHLFTLLKLQFYTYNRSLNQNQQQNQSHHQQNQPHISVIWTTNTKLNQVKSQVLTLWHDVWQYYCQPDMLQLLLSSILTISKQQIIDYTQNIITTCIMLLQRSCAHRQYANIFFKLTQNLTIKLFQLICITQSQYSLLDNDIDYFIQLNDDFCKQQQLQTLKTRAGSLLANLTLTIDGYLTFVTQIALVSIRQHLIHEEKPQTQTNIWNNILSTWKCTKQQLIQTSILILSSISDQISKRNDLFQPIQYHLQQLIPYFNIQSQLSQHKLFIMRYMQLYSFYSFPLCLDHFIRLYSSQIIYQKQLSKSFETLMRYYDRKNPSMEQYVKLIANSIMLLGDLLTPLLEQQIMKNNKVIQNFKQNILEKLVIWFLQSYTKQQVLRINKLSTLIVRLLQDNKLSQLTSDQNMKPFSSKILDTYLDKVYKQLQIIHPCQQSIIQIAISHVQYLYDMEDIDIDSCKQFYHIAKIVTQRNQLSLNDCLLLFNSLVCPDVPSNRKGKCQTWKFHHLTVQISLQIFKDISQWLNTMWQKGHQISQINQHQQQYILRQQDVWQMLQLAQICLFQIQINHNIIMQKRQPQIILLKKSTSQILNFGLKVADQCQSKTLKCKIISIVLQIVQMFPQNTENYSFLTHLIYPNPCQFPADQCRKYLYCLIKIMNNYMTHFDPTLRVRILRVIIDLVYFLQNQKAHIKTYDQKLFINGDAVSLNAIQKKSKIYSAFDYRINFNPHDQFRSLIQRYPTKQQLSFLNQQKSYQGRIRDLVDKIIVNDKTRKKLTVKRNY